MWVDLKAFLSFEKSLKSSSIFLAYKSHHVCIFFGGCMGKEALECIVLEEVQKVSGRVPSSDEWVVLRRILETHAFTEEYTRMFGNLYGYFLEEKDFGPFPKGTPWGRRHSSYSTHDVFVESFLSEDKKIYSFDEQILGRTLQTFQGVIVYHQELKVVLDNAKARDALVYQQIFLVRNLLGAFQKSGFIRSTIDLCFDTVDQVFLLDKKNTPRHFFMDPGHGTSLHHKTFSFVMRDFFSSFL